MPYPPHLVFTTYNRPERGIHALTAVPYDSTQPYDITIPLRLRHTLYPAYLPTYPLRPAWVTVPHRRYA